LLVVQVVFVASSTERRRRGLVPIFIFIFYFVISFGSVARLAAAAASSMQARISAYFQSA
jgi:uncharacterized membrane protein YadS